MINDKMFAKLAIVMIVPTLLLFVFPDYSSIITIISPIAVLLVIRQTLKNVQGNLFGGKMKYQCLTCSGTKFDSKGTCYRCGSKSRRPI